MKLRNFHKSQKGVASLYAVIFATILFGVITLSFVRIILSEARQSGDDELSQSAYDSALAGVEDAKRAVNKYYDCLNGGNDKAYCDANFNPFDASCEDFTSTTSKLKRTLGYQNVEGEIKIQESNTLSNGDDTATDQAYTCITMSRVVEDYRSTLTNDTRVRVVPLGVESNELSKVKTVEFKWFSENNGTDVTNDSYRLYKNKGLKNINDTSKVPVIALTLLHTGPNFQISEFNNSTSPNYSTMILLPSDSDEATNNPISWSEIQKAGNSDYNNVPFLVRCSQGEFACTAKLDLANNLQNGGNAMLVISMPYGETVSDFAISMYDASGDVIKFEGTQISVDSTGRANQLYRRIETRLDPADGYFPYPQFAIELDGDSDSKLWKNFWVTYNCWTQGGPCTSNNGVLPE